MKITFLSDRKLLRSLLNWNVYVVVGTVELNLYNLAECMFLMLLLFPSLSLTFNTYNLQRQLRKTLFVSADFAICFSIVFFRKFTSSLRLNQDQRHQ